MLFNRLRLSPLPFLMLGGFPAVLFGQATSVVQISGVVSDSNAGVIARARVKAIQTDTGLERVTITGADGTYALPNLPVGPYRLTAAADGFRTYVQTGIVLQVNTNPIINITLEVGTLSQQVEVSADATMVETQTNGVSQVIDQRRVVDLPLNGRQPTQLILLSGAAVTAPSSDMASSKNYPSSTTIAVAGGQANGTFTCSTAATTTMRSARLICHCHSRTLYWNLVCKPMPFRPATVCAPAPWSTLSQNPARTRCMEICSNFCVRAPPTLAHSSLPAATTSNAISSAPLPATPW